MTKIHGGSYRRKYKQCIWAAICIIGACFSLMLAPEVNYSSNRGSVASGIFLSTLTWFFVLTAAVLVQRISSFAAARAAGDPGYAAERYRHARIGLLSFAENTEGLLAEIALAVGVVIWFLRAARIIYVDGPMRMLQYSLCFSGFLLHCFFNGKSYIYIKRKAKRKAKKVEKRGAHL